ncbi:MAG: hypothetical protein AAF495_25385 [Pseudomonadota bacterium]
MLTQKTSNAEKTQLELIEVPYDPGHIVNPSRSVMVDVWDPEGQKHTVSNLNAHDLVHNVMTGWSYEPIEPQSQSNS